MTESALFSRIEKDIIDTYGDVAAPNYRLVEKRFCQGWYDDFIHVLREAFEIKETTDLNYDLARFLVLSYGSNYWSLDLSFVGRYANCFRLDPNSFDRNENLSDSVKLVSSEEQFIFNSLKSFGITLLDQEMLEHDFTFRHVNWEVDNVTLYQVLFCDTEILPWNYDSAALNS